MTISQEEFFEIQAENEARIVRLFHGSGGAMRMCLVARYLGGSRAAIEYIEQAPILVPLAWPNRWHVPQKAMICMSRAFAADCARGLKLRDLMHEQGPAAATHPALYQLRAFKGPAIRERHFWGMMVMARVVPPSMLAQAIPKSVTRQRAFAGAMGEFARRLGIEQTAGDVVPAAELVRWFVGALAGHGDMPPTHEVISQLVDYQRAHVLEPRWSLARAIEASNDWHDGRPLERVGLLADAAGHNWRPLNFLPSSVAVPYDPLPQRAIVSGYEFVALRSEAALYEESAAMRHCVHSYWPRVRDRRSWLFSMRTADDGGAQARIATVEFAAVASGGQQYRTLLEPQEVRGPNDIMTGSDEHAFIVAVHLNGTTFMLNQIKGQRNARVEPEVRAAARKFAELASRSTRQGFVPTRGEGDAIVGWAEPPGILRWFDEEIDARLAVDPRPDSTVAREPYTP